MKGNAKKLVTAIALLGIAAGVYFVFGRSSSSISNSNEFICVETGQVYTLSGSDIPAIMPAANPDTGRFTLLPLDQRSGGQSVVKLFIYEALQDPEFKELCKYVDHHTYKVLDTPR